MDVEYLFKELVKLQQIMSLTKTYKEDERLNRQNVKAFNDEPYKASTYFYGMSGRCFDSAVEKVKMIKDYVRNAR